MRILQALRACTLILLPLLAHGQQVSAPEPQPAGISGSVTDVQGAVIPNAAVLLEGPAAADKATATTGNDGLFAFNDLRPSVAYHVTISANGFAEWSSPPITLQQGQQLNLSAVHLTISVVQTTVTAVSPEEAATQEIKIAEKQRVLGVFPNFYVVYTPNPAPLTTKTKYKLAIRTTYDPVNILGIAFFAAVDQAGDSPDYQQGAKGYAQRFGAGMADSFTDVMLGGAVLPSLLHQDPRYFYQGTGTIKSRVWHAIASPFVCKGDNGHDQFNLSSIGGDLASASISNLYYPDSNRGPGLVFTGTLISTGGRIVDALAQEFIFHHFTPSAKKRQAAQATAPVSAPSN
jgi:hypothetical protein